MSQSGYVHLEDCTIRKVTANAALVEWEGDEYWLPLSQISDGDSLEQGSKGVTVSITEWIAEQKGIET